MSLALHHCMIFNFSAKNIASQRFQNSEETKGIDFGGHELSAYKKDCIREGIGSLRSNVTCS